LSQEVEKNKKERKRARDSGLGEKDPAELKAQVSDAAAAVRYALAKRLALRWSRSRFLSHRRSTASLKVPAGRSCRRCVALSLSV
jgi:hypothetical protein